MQPRPIRHRILIPAQHCTRIPNRVFTEELCELKENGSAALYLLMIDWAFHKSGVVIATRAELARAINMDERGVKKCLAEISSKGFIKLWRKGVTRSQVNKDHWRIPAARREALEDGWTPIPRFIFQRYIPAYRNAVLLPLLIHHQHLGWNNWCWVQTPKLSTLLNWSRNRVREALRTMFAESGWRELGTGLPRPLAVKTMVRPKKLAGSYTQTIRHYRVLAVEYTTQQTESLRSIFIPKTYRQYFGIALNDQIQSVLSSIFRSRGQHSESEK